MAKIKNQVNDGRDFLSLSNRIKGKEKLNFADIKDTPMKN
jgi:hypothetical protein